MRTGTLFVAALTTLVLPILSPLLALEGVVSLPGGAPGGDALVSVIGRPGSTRADSAGRFVLRPAPTPPFEVLVVLADGRLTAPLLIDATPATGSLVLEVQPLAVERVTVTAGAAPRTETPPASATTAITREELQRRHAQRLTDIVETVPGAGRLGEAHASVPSLRGLARGRTLILIDGARVTTERRAGPSASFVDPFFMESLEISRGPGSVAYGSDALGGVIHARTRVADTEVPWSFRLRTQAGLGVPERNAGFEVAHGYGDGGVVLQLRDRRFGDYRSPKGSVPNSAARDQGVRLRWDHRLARGTLSAGWQRDVGRDIGKPRSDWATRRNYYPIEESNRLTLSFRPDARWGLEGLNLEAFLGTYRLLLEREALADDGLERSVTRSDVAAHDFGVRAMGDRALGSGRVRFGLDLNGRFGLDAVGDVESFDAGGATLSRVSESALDEARRIDAGLFAATDVPLGSRVDLSAGLRVDRVTSQARGGFFGSHATHHTAVTGFTSATWRPFTGADVTAQISRGFRDPTLSDRYFRGASGRGTVTGNPDLDPETSLQLDLALRYVRRGLRCALYLYDYRIDDLVERYETEDDQFFFRNRGSARRRGAEFEVQLDAGRGFFVDLGAQTASGVARDDGSHLDDTPADSVSLQLRRELPRGYAMLRASAFARDEHFGPTERETPGYATFDLGGGLRLSPHAELRLWLRNVLDRSYPATPDRKSVLAPGRSASAALTFAF